MFKTIEIKIGGKKLIIDECDYRKYPDVIKTIKGFINECLTLEGPFLKAGEDLFEGDLLAVEKGKAYKADRKVYTPDELAAMRLKNGCKVIYTKKK